MLRRDPTGAAAFDHAFLADWSALPRTDRLRLSRAIRWGRPFEADDAPMGTRYARFQLDRPWMRYFWFWFVPAIVVCALVASQIHPLVVGAALAVGAQAVMKWRNLRRIARTVPPGA